MKIKQLSVFLENRPGQLRKPLLILADAGVDIKTISLADTQQFGILRLIMRDWEKSFKLLQDAGFVVKETDVLAIEVLDRPGGLHSVFEKIESAGLNVEYMYAFASGQGDSAIIIFRFEDIDAAIKALQENAIIMVDNLKLFSAEP